MKKVKKSKNSPHSEETSASTAGFSWYQKSYPKPSFLFACCSGGSQRPLISNVEGSSSTKPLPSLENSKSPSSLASSPSPSSFFSFFFFDPMNETMIDSGAQWLVCGSATPTFSCSSEPKSVLASLGALSLSSPETSTKWMSPLTTPGTTRKACVFSMPGRSLHDEQAFQPCFCSVFVRGGGGGEGGEERNVRREKRKSEKKQTEKNQNQT